MKRMSLRALTMIVFMPLIVAGCVHGPEPSELDVELTAVLEEHEFRGDAEAAGAARLGRALNEELADIGPYGIQKQSAPKEDPNDRSCPMTTATDSSPGSAATRMERVRSQRTCTSSA